MSREIYLLKDWMFQIGNDETCLRNGRTVTIPHTWNVETETEDVTANGWYAHQLMIPAEWSKKAVRLRFCAVYHDTEIFLNGQKIHEHRNSGYTPFVVDVTDRLNFGEINHLTLKVNNEYSQQLLPYMRSFDWPNDGGIIRDVELIVTGKTYIDSFKTTAKPIILTEDSRQEVGDAIFGLQIIFNKNLTQEQTLAWSLTKDGSSQELCSGITESDSSKITIARQLINGIHYWHFDRPSLYVLSLNLISDGTIEDSVQCHIGFRDFHVQGSKFYLNGEAVRLCGTEWMPGSDPLFGMAETKEQLTKMLVRLKESNCIFTRFHWQQDDYVYDWCDRHGMLIQEEIPFWGTKPTVAGETQKQVFQQQITEMVHAHCNHPSIISWGVGNELNANEEETIQYIKDAVAYTHHLDSNRTANYISNTLFEDPKRDGTIYGDFMMVNEYIGTWMKNKDVQEELTKVLTANPGKPLVSSEFGLCEPAFSGGDKRRTEIFIEKMNHYRQFPEIAGSIYFCLNDYRTQMGEEGEGKYKCRVHGSTGLDGTPKPSYYDVQRECAPFSIDWCGKTMTITCRDSLPCYMMKNYTGVLLDSNDIVLEEFKIPDLFPGQQWMKKTPSANRLAVYRPNMDYAGTYSSPMEC